MTKRVETIKGEAITEDMVQAWAEEAEIGYTPAQLHSPRRGRPLIGAAPATALSVRFDQELLALVRQNADERHMTPSEVVREAVRQYLHSS